MLTPEEIAALGDAAADVAVSIEEWLIKDIARRIAGAGQLTSTAAYQIYRAQQLGLSRKQIEKMLRKELKVSHKELRRLLTQSAEVGYSFELRHLSRAAVPFAGNAALQQMVQAAVELAKKDFTNLVQTLGMVAPDGKAYPLQKVYQKTMDFAFQQVFTGAADYNTAIRQACRNLADMGVRVIDYESGVHTSLEAAVRRNMLGGMGLMQEKISQYNHDELGADGWEISAHAASAPDHEPFQGKQYSDEAYQKLNGMLKRRIGTLNCGHAAFPILLGVSSPQYTKEQLEAFRAQNEKGVSYQGKQYSLYEASQKQRQVERAIRKQKNRILVAEATGDKEQLQIAQIRLGRLNEEYLLFSRATGQRTQRERAWVAGFGRGQAARAGAAKIKIEKLANSMYDIGSTKENVDAWLRDKPLRDMLRSGAVPLTILPGQQKKHIPGTLEYSQYVAKLTKIGQFGPSRLGLPQEDAQELVNRYCGSGVLERRDDGTWKNVESITVHEEIIGVAVNNITGVEADTTTFKIHYGKKGTHIVPDYPSRKGGKAKR